MAIAKRVSLLALLLLAAAGRTEGRDWNHQGNVLPGDFVRIRGDEVVLLQGTDSVVVKIAELSDEDRAFIASLTRERNWTNSAGKRIIASFVGRDAETVTIQKEGKEFTIPIASLSKSDQFYLDRKHPWTAGATIAPATPPAADATDPPPVVRPQDTASGKPARDASSDGVRIWTRINGRKIRGRFSRMTGQLVRLETDAGEEVVPLGILSPADQALVRKLLDGSAAEGGSPDAALATDDGPPPGSSSVPEAAPAVSEGDTWVLRDGKTVTGRFEKMQGNLVWLVRNPGTSVIPLDHFTDADRRRILAMRPAVGAPGVTPTPYAAGRPKPDSADDAPGADLTAKDPAAEYGAADDSPSVAGTTGETSVWHLRTGETVSGRFVKLNGSSVELDTDGATTSIKASSLEPADFRRALQLHSQQLQQRLAAGRTTPRTDPADPTPSAGSTAYPGTGSTTYPGTGPATYPATEPATYPAPYSGTDTGGYPAASPASPPATDYAASAPSTVPAGPACSECGAPGYVKPGERCPHCGAQKHWSRQLRIGEAPTQFGETPGPSSGRGSSRIRIGGRGLAKLVISIGLLLVSGFVGFLKFLFGSSSHDRV